MTDPKPGEKFTNERYAEVQEQLLLLARLVRDLPLVEFLGSIERAEAVGPFVDPTTYRAARKNLETIKRMARGLRAFQAALPAVCNYCGVKELAYEGALYCGAACSARAEAGT